MCRVRSARDCDVTYIPTTETVVDELPASLTSSTLSGVISLDEISAVRGMSGRVRGGSSRSAWFMSSIGITSSFTPPVDDDRQQMRHVQRVIM